MAKRTIAVDIGNTNTRIGLIDCFSLECIGKTTIRTIDVVKALPDAIHSVMQENKTPHPIEVIICSVVSIIPEDILSGLSPLQSQYTVSFFNYSPQLPVCITYKILKNSVRTESRIVSIVSKNFPGKIA
jgi:pantothenate kinase type III